MNLVRRRVILGVLLLSMILMLGLMGNGYAIVRAEDGEETPEPYVRKTTLTLSFLEHEWWLVRWKDNEIGCRVFIEHEGLPSSDEILTACGTSLHNQWLATKPCAQAESGEDVSKCSGLYLHYVEAVPGERTVEVELPLPTVWISLTGCEDMDAEGRCANIPTLLLSGEEPLPNEQIISIAGTINGEPFSCPGSTCEIPLQPTGSQGVEALFWAESSFGDASPEYTALVRVQPWGDFMSPDGGGSDPQRWYADVLSTQWRGGPLASCSDIWQVFPEMGGPPPWLDTPAQPEDLYSSYSFYFLAGMLISNGEVDASGCPDGGLQSPTVANACGVDVAYPTVVEWQNQFDQEIYQTALDTGVPAQLIKNIFSRESQLWPGIYKTYREAGLGQLTENGADTMLLWNPDFFAQFCPLVLHSSRCELGFGNLTEEEHAMLRGALVTKVNASCTDCPVGIDLTQANFSVRVFSEGLLANCEQVGRIVTNITGQEPRTVSTYVDLWEFTLVNYNAGAGCLTHALNEAWINGEPLDWEHVAPYLEPACQGALDYVSDISQVLSGIQPTPTSWVYQGTPLPQMTMGVLRTPLPTNTPSPIATTAEPGYPGVTATPLPTATSVIGYPYVTPSDETPTAYP